MSPFLLTFDNGFFLGNYGLLIAIGLFVAVALAVWRGKSRGIAAETFMDLAFISAVAGFVGGRILYIVTEWRDFVQDPLPILLSRSGFVFLGGFVGALLAAGWYIRRKKIDFWNAADVAMPSLAIGHAFGRIGCHLAGCCFGGVCAAPVGIRVPAVIDPNGMLWPNAYLDHLQRGLIGQTDAFSLAIYPVQLMEATGLFILAAIYWIVGLKPHRKGLVFGLYLVTYGIMRFVLEMLRGDENRGVFFGGAVSTSQLISVGLVIAGGIVLATMKGRPLWEYATPPSGEPEKKRPPVRRSGGSTPA